MSRAPGTLKKATHGPLPVTDLAPGPSRALYSAARPAQLAESADIPLEVGESRVTLAFSPKQGSTRSSDSSEGERPRAPQYAASSPPRKGKLSPFEPSSAARPSAAMYGQTSVTATVWGQGREAVSLSNLAGELKEGEEECMICRDDVPACVSFKPCSHAVCFACVENMRAKNIFKVGGAGWGAARVLCCAARLVCRGSQTKTLAAASSQPPPSPLLLRPPPPKRRRTRASSAPSAAPTSTDTAPCAGEGGRCAACCSLSAARECVAPHAPPRHCTPLQQTHNHSDTHTHTRTATHHRNRADNAVLAFLEKANKAASTAAQARAAMQRKEAAAARAAQLGARGAVSGGRQVRLCFKAVTGASRLSLQLKDATTLLAIDIS